MRVAIFLVFAAMAAVANTAVADTPSDSVLSTVHQFVDALNRADLKAAASVWTDEQAIVDVIPPHEWHGPNAFAAWAAVQQKAASLGGLSNLVIDMGASPLARVTGDTAYVVAPVTLTFKQRDNAMEEPAQMTLALRNGPNGWKIAAWTWVAGVPHPAK